MKIFLFRLRRLALNPVANGIEPSAAAIREFLRTEAAGGLVLIAAAAFAILCASTPLALFYEALRTFPIAVTAGGVGIAKPLLEWVNDGLMALFFFLAGLEIKREAVRGELSGISKALLPVLAALGGMAFPAFVYVAAAHGDSMAIKGWAIPAATDIAFALGVLSLLGSRVPQSLKVLLAALAVIDDLGAIIIIAIFYTSDLSWLSLGIAGIAVAALAAMNLSGVRRIAPYALIGLVCWIAVLKSGVHATLAGAITAMAVPMAEGGEAESPLERLEHVLHPWIAFLVLPLFGFLNAGVSLSHLNVEDLTAPVTLGVAAGLFFGKQLGVFGAVAFAVKAGLAPKPAGASWLQIYGLAALTGIGFTMSLFIGELAFAADRQDTALRIGVLVASVASALFGYAVLRLASRTPKAST